MKAYMVERGEYLITTHWPSGSLERCNRQRTCYKVQMVIATLFLVGGVASTSIGIPNILRILSDMKFKITAGINLPDLDITESITILVDKAELVKYVALAVSGLFSAFLSTGILWGMAYQHLR